MAMVRVNLGHFEFYPSKIENVLFIHLDSMNDESDCIRPIYSRQAFSEAGICEEFVQDNLSVSAKGVLRGLHVQVVQPNSKIIRVTKGKIYDVIVDARINSSTFGQYEGRVLDDINRLQAYIPKGCAHGFIAMEETTCVEFKVSEIYRAGGEVGIRWDDPTIGIPWPVSEFTPTLSEKDRCLASLQSPEVLEALQKAEF